MPETEQQDRTLSEIVVKEAVEKGLDSPLRDSILEAVEEAEGGRGGSRIPLAGAVFGLGAALGFLAGRQSTDLEEMPLEDINEPEIIEDVTERAESQMAGEEPETAETESEEMEGESGSRLPRLLLALGAIAAAVLVRRQLAGEEEEEWEPIEEFEPATGGDEGAEEESEEAEGEESEEEAEETEEEEEVEEEEE